MTLTLLALTQISQISDKVLLKELMFFGGKMVN